MQRTYPVPPTSRKAIARRVGVHVPNNLITWLAMASALMVLLLLMTIGALMLGSVIVYGSGRVLPGVSTAGIKLGGLTVEDAAATLQSAWGSITLRDGDRTWSVDPVQIGLTLDAQATAIAAQNHGRIDGALFAAIFGSDSVVPV